MVRAGAVCLLVVILGVCSLTAWQAKPAFEVASIKVQSQAPLDGIAAIVAQSPFMTFHHRPRRQTRVR